MTETKKIIEKLKAALDETRKYWKNEKYTRNFEFGGEII